ncbi:MAG TPA: cation-transporting P-type ATPase, partial [Dehalococcoidia bacterium]|nr:cation-transporting P-type ATPase [Dehalococcoidia bacterium]
MDVLNTTQSITVAEGKAGGASRPGDDITWHSVDGGECADKLGVDPATGLSAADAAVRLERYGLNQLTGDQRTPVWLAFLRQYRPLMQMVLIGAAVVSALIGNLSTAGVLIGVSVLNAVLGMLQE